MDFSFVDTLYDAFPTDIGQMLVGISLNGETESCRTLTSATETSEGVLELQTGDSRLLTFFERPEITDSSPPLYVLTGPFVYSAQFIFHSIISISNQVRDDAHLAERPLHMHQHWYF